jgi:hypothetical protein
MGRCKLSNEVLFITLHLLVSKIYEFKMWHVFVASVLPMFPPTQRGERRSSTSKATSAQHPWWPRDINTQWGPTSCKHCTQIRCLWKLYLCVLLRHLDRTKQHLHWLGGTVTNEACSDVTVVTRPLLYYKNKAVRHRMHLFAQICISSLCSGLSWFGENIYVPSNSCYAR